MAGASWTSAPETGTGTIVLAQRFGAADVIAVDGSEQLPGRILAKAGDLGLAGRIRTIQADLDGAWPAVGTVDVAWAAMFLHHLADPARVPGDLFAAIRPSWPWPRWPATAPSPPAAS